MLVSAKLVLNRNALHDEWLLALSISPSQKRPSACLVEVSQVLLTLQVSL